MKQRNLIVLLFAVLLGLAFRAPILAEQLAAITNQTIPSPVPLAISCPTDLPPGTVTYTGTVTVEKSAYIAALTGDMNQPHSYHTATLLQNGRVLIAGSSSINGRTAEVYNPTAGTFTLTGNLNQPRYYHAATRLLDGRVLIVGGGSEARTTAEIYDPTTGTFTLTGNLNHSRTHHTATLLPDGRVLITGSSSVNGSTAEVYDPTTGTFTPTGNLNRPRFYHTATLLTDGRVLIVGGNPVNGSSSNTAEIYDPTTGTFILTGSLKQPRFYHTATRLADGSVLILGGGYANGISSTAEVYDPNLGTFTLTGDLNQSRHNPSATLLLDGRVLIVGDGSSNDSSHNTAEIYDPTLGTFTLTGNLSQARYNHTATRLLDGRVLLVDGSGSIRSTPEVATLSSSNTFSASLTLPAGWESIQSSIVVTVTGITTGTAIHSGTMINGSGWGPWIDMRPGIPVTTTFFPRFDYQTGSKSILLRLRDQNLLPDQQPIVIDVTISDTKPPTGGSIAINGGAIVTTDPSVTLTLGWPVDRFCLIKSMRFSDDGVTWGTWRDTINDTGYTLADGSGERIVYAQFRDFADNVSEPISDTIRLDTGVGSDSLMTINHGATWTNSTGVTLTVGAPLYTTQMQISNDGGFANAIWQPFDSRPAWQIVAFGSYAIPRTVYVRVRGNSTTPSSPYSDDIIFDPVAPVGRVSIQSISATSVEVTLEANDPDNLSGVAQMRVALQNNFDQAGWEPFSTTKTLDIPNVEPKLIVFAKFKDGAGNETGILSTSANRTVDIYLPRIDK